MTSLLSLPTVQSSSDATAPSGPASVEYTFTHPTTMASGDHGSEPTTPASTPLPRPASTAVTSQLRLPKMQSASDRIATADSSFTGYTFTHPSDMASGDETSEATTPTATSLLAATPRTSQILSHGSAGLLDGAVVSTTPSDEKLTTYTTETIQLPAITESTTQQHTKQSSQLESTLLSRLPRELRDQIYREVVLEDDEIPIHVISYKTKTGKPRRALRIEHKLLQVCKQTRQEVADIYYLENTFCVSDDLFEKRAIRELGRFLTPWAERMNRLKVSHKFVHSLHVTAEISLFVSGNFEDRIYIEPGTVSARTQRSNVVLITDEGTLKEITETFSNVCFCDIFSLVAQRGVDNVLKWAQIYVHFILARQGKLTWHMPHCWNCANRVVI